MHLPGSKDGGRVYTGQEPELQNGHSGLQQRNTMAPRLFVVSIVMLSIFWPAASFVTATPTPPYPGASPSLAYKVTVDGQPVFAYRYPTYNQFNWMDCAGFSMAGKVHVTITSLISERDVRTCFVRPLAYNIHPQIKGDTVSFDLDRPRYLVVFINEEPLFSSCHNQG